MLRNRLQCTLTKPYSVWIENNFSKVIESKSKIEKWLSLSESGGLTIDFLSATVLDEIKFYPYPSRVQQRLDYLKERNSKVTEKYLLDQKRTCRLVFLLAIIFNLCIWPVMDWVVRAGENQTKKVIEKAKESPQQNDVDLTRLSLREQHPGIITWAKIAGHNWWPGKASTLRHFFNIHRGIKHSFPRNNAALFR